MKQENIEDIYELSPMQQGMLFHQLAAPNSGVYFEQFCNTLQTQLNVSAFQKAWQQILSRHPILRTSFYWENLDKPYQVVYKQVDLPWEFLDWRKISLQEQQSQLEALLKADRDRGFELSQVPLIRLVLIQIADETYQFIFNYHHILMEGWSLNWLWKEFYQFYHAFTQGQDLHLERPRPYKEYIVWLQQQDMSQAKDFWHETLKGFTASTPFLGDKASSSAGLRTQDKDDDRQQIHLSEAFSASLKSFVRKHHLTLNILFKGVWALLLSHYSRESDIVFGATSSGRPAALMDAESMVGLFINTLPMRVQVDNDTFLLPWLKKLQAQEVQMRQYEYSPMLLIQQWSEIPRGLPLFESILVFNSYLVDSTQHKLAQSMGNTKYLSFGFKTNYPLTVVIGTGSELSITITYDTNRFDSSMINRMLGHLKTLLTSMIANPTGQLRDLQLLTAQESYQLLTEWNNTEIKYPQQQSIHQLFETQVERTPNAIAVVFQDQKLTYCELNAKANQLAHYLQKLGVRPEVLVGICLERSLDMVIGLLGIIKAGGAYVPLDPNYPSERLSYMLTDANFEVLLTQQSILESLPSHTAQMVCLDTDWHVIQQYSQENIDSGVSADNLIYVIYTSGSTGLPKGVMNTHQGIHNRLLWMQQTYQLTSSDRVLQKTPFSFDVSVWEFFWPLITGAAIVVAQPEGHKDNNYLVNLITQEQITTIHFVPSMLQVFLQAANRENCSSLKRVFCSGEALGWKLTQSFFEKLNCELYNLYGPTESAIEVTFWQCQPQADLQIVPIGRPISNIQIYILDNRLQPVPIGVVGELYIGGHGLARGYLNRPELTAEKFIQNPFSDDNSKRLYKTGDLARYLNDGNIQYLGRIDNQVKIRGFRIELGEIEAVINTHPQVQQAVVIARVYHEPSQREDIADRKRLVAYVVTSDASLTSNQLREFIKQKLPEYMIPSAFVMLDNLPLTPNGKIDSKALPMPNITRPDLAEVYHPPQTEVEKAVANIWQELLHVETVGIHDNFFELGGHSLLLVQIHSKLQKIFQRDFPLVEMFQYPTISCLATHLGQESSEQQSFTQHSPRPESRTTSIQRRKEARKEHRAVQKGGSSE